MRFKDKSAIVTGAAYGIGRATALAFAREGAKLMICDYNPERLAETEKMIKKLGGTVMSMAFDIRDSAKIDEMMERVHTEYGSVDILVNNAGVGQFNPFPTTSEDEWDTIMGINAKAVYMCCRAAVPYMMDYGKGAIVNITSIMGEFAAIAQSIYNTSKGAAKMLTQAIEKDLGETGIRCNAVAILNDHDRIYRADVQTGSAHGFSERIPLGRRRT